MAACACSNWALDPAKMSRAVHLFRPAPEVEDLALTAQGMVRSANLKGYLNALARAYHDVYHGQTQQDFWGLREYYSTVRAINSYLGTAPSAASTADTTGDGESCPSSALTGSMLLKAILRNYGGRPSETEHIVSVFFDHLGLPVPRKELQERRTEALIRENLREADARHLMLLTKNNAALGMLLGGWVGRGAREWGVRC